MGSIISVTTDFGCSDGYQGVIEGVIAGINPAAGIITISHHVAPGDIADGWYLLKSHYYYFPPGTVHLAVVDPGVGTQRKIVAVKTGQYTFVAPDNGLLSFIPPKEIVSIHSITNRKYALASVSPVFHGRDIMAPAAAYLSLGVDFSCFGRPLSRLQPLDIKQPRKTKKGILGTVLRIDRFGNLVTNITDLPDKARVSVNGHSIGPIRKTFASVPKGRPVAYIGSGGHLEIAVRDDSAVAYFSITCKEDTEIVVAT